MNDRLAPTPAASVEALNRVLDVIGEVPSPSAYEAKRLPAEPSVTEICELFDGWPAALAAAQEIADADIVNGMPSSNSIVFSFGTWDNALEAAEKTAKERGISTEPPFGPRLN